MNQKDFRQLFQKELGRILNRDAESVDEVVEIFNELYTVIEQLKKYTDDLVVKTTSETSAQLQSLSAYIDDVKQSLDKKETEIKKTVGAVDLKFDAELAQLKQSFTADFKKIYEKLNDIQTIQGEPGEKGDPGKDGSPDTPEQVRDKLETLEGEDRLDKSAIKGLDDLDKRFAQVASIPRGNGGGQPVKVKNSGTLLSDTPISVINFNTNLTATQSGSEVTVNASGGGGSGGHTIQEDGSDLTARTNLNFDTGLVATDDSGSDATDITLDDEYVQDLVGAMFTGNTETLITVTYQDADGTIDLVVDNDLANYDNTNTAFVNAAGAVSAVASDDAYLANDGDVGTGVYDFGGATSFEIPNGATPTVDAAGEIAIDTTITDHTGLIKYHDGTEELTVIAVPTANLTTTDDYVLAYDADNNEFYFKADATGAGGSGSMTTVKSNGSQVGGADIVTLDFSDDFDVTESPDTEVNITFDYSKTIAYSIALG